MIDSHRFGLMIIGGRQYTADLKIIDGVVVPEWWRREGHSICVEDIADIAAAKPDILILGTGVYGLMKVPERFKRQLESLGIELLAEPTEKAVALYNQLHGERNVAAGFHLTC